MESSVNIKYDKFNEFFKKKKTNCLFIMCYFISIERLFIDILK